MLVVVTVYWQGGPVFTREWVHALKAGLDEYLPSGVDFACLTNDPGLNPRWRIPLVGKRVGWWTKLELFRPGLFEGCRVLYMDLDTLPLGNLEDIVGYRGEFAMLSDFFQPKIPASGVMAWRGGALDHLWEEANKSSLPPHRTRFDYWIGPRVQPERLQTLFPGQIYSYKRDSIARPPSGARLICGHGRPRFSEPRAGWAHKLWYHRTKQALAPL